MEGAERKSEKEEKLRWSPRGVLRRWVEAARTFPEMPEGVHRPKVFSLMFWGALLVAYAWQVIDQRLAEIYPDSRYEPSGLLPATLAAAGVVAAWTALPWNPRVPGRRKLAAPLFLATVFAFVYFTGADWGLILYLVVAANGTFLFGFGRGVAYAAAMLPVIFANVMLVYVVEGVRNGALLALFMTLVLLLANVPVVGICATVAEVVRRREETSGLLEEIRASYERLEAANAELERYAAEVRRLAVSEERARMAREMHDTVGHHLTVINLQLENARRSGTKDPQKAWQEVDEAKDLTLQALSEVRRAVRALKPPALDGEGGAGALSELARSFEGTGFEIGFRKEGKERELPDGAWLVFYRALQEGLTNAAKHSGGRRAAATLSFGEDHARLIISDDGTGARTEDLQKGFGLPALKGRVEAAGGSFWAQNLPGGGFGLEVSLPYEPSDSSPGASRMDATTPSETGRR